MKPDIFGIRNRCCGRVDLENAVSWYRMSVLHMYSCCMLVMTSGLRFTFNCTTCMGSVSIFFSLSGIMVHFFALATVYVVVFCRDHYLVLLLWTLRRFREVREVGRASVSSSPVEGLVL